MANSPVKKSGSPTKKSGSPTKKSGSPSTKVYVNGVNARNLALYTQQTDYRGNVYRVVITPDKSHVFELVKSAGRSPSQSPTKKSRCHSNPDFRTNPRVSTPAASGRCAQDYFGNKRGTSINGEHFMAMRYTNKQGQQIYRFVPKEVFVSDMERAKTASAPVARRLYERYGREVTKKSSPSKKRKASGTKASPSKKRKTATPAGKKSSNKKATPAEKKSSKKKMTSASKKKVTSPAKNASTKHRASPSKKKTASPPKKTASQSKKKTASPSKKKATY